MASSEFIAKGVRLLMSTFLLGLISQIDHLCGIHLGGVLRLLTILEEVFLV